VEPSARDSLTVQRANREGVFPVSALTGEGVADLLDAVSDAFAEVKVDEVLQVPFASGRARARLHAMGVVTGEEPGEDGHAITVRWTERQKAQWQAG
ncbi:MAG: GTPase HflX, partial [Paracoccaceae bacterium]